MIEAENASFTYQSAPSPALQDVTLTVQPGECVVLCGRSGCGKTTFTHLLNGLSPEFYPGTLTGRCTAAGLAAGEAAIEAYVPQVGSVFQNPKTQYFNVDTTAELASLVRTPAWSRRPSAAAWTRSSNSSSSAR